MLSPAALTFLRYNPTASLEETYLRNRLAIRVNCNLLDDLPQIDGFFSLIPREISRVTALPYDHPDRASPGCWISWGYPKQPSRARRFDWAPRPSAMPLVTAGQQPVFADDRAAFDALSQTNLDLRQIVFLPLEARGSISATQQTAARVLDASSPTKASPSRPRRPPPAWWSFRKPIIRPGRRMWMAGRRNLARQLRLPGPRSACGTSPNPTGLRRQEAAYGGGPFRLGLAGLRRPLGAAPSPKEPTLKARVNGPRLGPRPSAASHALANPSDLAWLRESPTFCPAPFATCHQPVLWIGR